MSGTEPTLLFSEVGLDPDRLIFEGIDTTRYPTFSVGETAKFFFARSASWLRTQDNAGKFITEDEGFVVRRRVAKNARFFCLEDIEKMAHALATNGQISTARLRIVLSQLKIQGRLWEYIGGE